MRFFKLNSPVHSVPCPAGGGKKTELIDFVILIKRGKEGEETNFHQYKFIVFLFTFFQGSSTLFLCHPLDVFRCEGQWWWMVCWGHSFFTEQSSCWTKHEWREMYFVMASWRGKWGEEGAMKKRRRKNCPYSFHLTRLLIGWVNASFKRETKSY